MKKPLAIGITTLAVMLSFGLVACGSSDDTSSNEDVLTKQELIAQADKICQKANGDLVTKADEALTPDSTQKDAEAFIKDEVVPLYQDEIEQLRALTPDEADAEAYTEMIDTLESELQKIEQDPSLMMSQATAFPEATKMAKEFGLTVCGSGSGES